MRVFKTKVEGAIYPIMKKMKKYHALFLTAICAISTISIPTFAEAEAILETSDGRTMIINPGEFPIPGHLPHSLEDAQSYFTTGNSDWVNCYYAPGTGLELNIYNVDYSDSIYVATIFDYHKYDYQLPEACNVVIANGLSGIEMNLADENTLTNEYFTLTKEGDQIRMDLSDSYNDYLYRDAITVEYAENGDAISGVSGRAFSSILFTDIITLMENPQEDLWGGSWGYSAQNENPQGQEYESYVSMKQLYGTSDYISAERIWTEYNEMSDWIMTFFESDQEKLYSFMAGPSELNPENTYYYYRKNSAGELMRWDFPLRESMLDYDEDDSPSYHYTLLTSKMLWDI